MGQAESTIDKNAHIVWAAMIQGANHSLQNEAVGWTAIEI